MAERKHRAVIALALGIVVGMGFAFALTWVIMNQVVQAVVNAQSRGAVRATFNAVFDGLRDISAILIGISLVIAVVAFLAGASRPAAAIPRHSAAVGRSLVGRSGGKPPPVSLSWIPGHRMLLGLLGLGVAIVISLVVVSGWVGFLTTVLVFAGYEGLLV